MAGAGQQRPPGQGLSKKARRRRAAKAAGVAGFRQTGKKVRLGRVQFPPMANVYSGPMPRGSSLSQRKAFRSSGQMQAAPAAMQRVRSQNAPRMQMSGNGQVCVVTHREYIAEVPGATAWTTTTYAIQPALQTLFVWLATIASNFEKYRFRALRFCYETESPTSQGGSIVLTIDYDAADAAPASKQAALSYKSSVRSAPWEECCLVCDLGRDAERDLMYTRRGANPAGTDIKLYDLGNLFVGTQNSSGSTGELWVEYTIELHTPTVSSQPISGKEAGTAAETASALLGSDGAYATGSNVGWTITNSSTFTCSVAGSYLFAGLVNGTTLVASGFANGGTSTSVISSAFPNAGATSVLGFAVVTAQVGQTYIPSITSAVAVSSTAWRIATYNGALS